MSAPPCGQPCLSGCCHHHRCHPVALQLLQGHIQQLMGYTPTSSPFVSPSQRGQSHAHPVSSQIQHSWCHRTTSPGSHSAQLVGPAQEALRPWGVCMYARCMALLVGEKEAKEPRQLLPVPALTTWLQFLRTESFVE